MNNLLNYYEILVGIILIGAINLNSPWLVLCQQDPSLDQILKDLSILTRQQLETPQAPTPQTLQQNASPKAESNSGLTASSVKAKLDSPLRNSKQFTLPAKYDPNKPPKMSKVKPLVINVNMTVLHAAHDKHENLITLDLEMKECWRDKRLRIKLTESDKENDEDEDDDLMSGSRRLESFMLEAEWASRLWHPVGRVQGSAEVRTTLTGRASVPKPKNLEQEALIESIYIVANTSTAYVWMSLKLRLAIPAYECIRDDSTLYPFDKIKCSFNIVNVLLDKRSLIYKWESIKWQPSGYQTGEFYLRDLSQSITSQSVTDIDRSSSEHSSLQVEFLLKRHIGDYVLNVYVLHIFLLALCVASFWISITNVVIRMSLSIIILIIIKFQTIQTLKTEHHIVSALSVWTFGLSCLVILSLLCHILSYYSVQHKWNDKVLSRLVRRRQETGKRDSGERDLEMDGTGRSPDNNSHNQPEHSSPITTPTAANLTGTNSSQDQWRIRLNKIKQNCLLWLNSIILNNTKSVGYDKSNLVDIISRIALIFVYSLFVIIYFSKYVL